jgi:hypothetical protein
MRLSAFVIASSFAIVALPGAASADPAQTAPVQAAPVQSTSPQPAPVKMSDASQASTSDPDQIVCRMEPPPTGTRLGGRRVCHTQHDWDEQMKAAQRLTMDKQQVGGVPNQQ